MSLHHPNYNNITVYGIKSPTVRYSWASYLILIIASSIIGDTLILIASIKYRAVKLHRALVLIIQHMVVCDLILSVLDIFPKLVFVLKDRWEFGHFACVMSPHIRHCLNLTNILLNCAITCSKLMLLRYPLRFGSIDRTVVRCICISCWLVALIWPAIFLFSDIKFNDVEISYRGYSCEFEFTSVTWKWLGPVFGLFFGLIPLTTVTATTICLLKRAKNVVRRDRKTLKWQGIVTTILTAAVFIISYLPYQVYRAGQFFTASYKSNSFFHVGYFRLTNSFLYLSTSCNFYICYFTVHSFRNFLWSKLGLFVGKVRKILSW